LQRSGNHKIYKIKPIFGDTAFNFLPAECEALDRSINHWERALLRLSWRTLGEEDGRRLQEKYRSLFTDFYQHLVSPRYALKDMLQLERISTSRCQRVSLLKPCQGIEHYRLHFYSRKEKFLDEYIPVLENMNLRVMDQVQFSVEAGDETLFIKSFTIKAENIQENIFLRLRKRMLDAIQAIMDERVENDPLNKLIVLTGMSWQEVDALRAYRNYYLQLGPLPAEARVERSGAPGGAGSVSAAFATAGQHEVGSRHQRRPDLADPVQSDRRHDAL
jgi:glutamate dehydrogenase